MSGELAPKLRVVRCPKCRLLLEESPQYDVYKCGGCGTILIAKKRKSAAVNSESSTPEIDAAPTNTLDLVSEDKPRSNREQLVPPLENGLREKATSSSSGECSLDGNGGRGQNENGECNGDQLGTFNLSDEELENELDIYKLSLRRRRVSNKGCSNEMTHCEIEASSALMGDNSVEEANDTNLQLAGAEELNNRNLLLEGAKKELTCASDEDGNNEKSALVGVKSEVEITKSDLEGAGELNNGNLLLEGAEELISGSDGEDANNDKSALVGPNPEVEITGSDLEGAEEELISGSDGQDANNGKSALEGLNPEVEITGRELEGSEELHNGNLLLEGAEEESISGSDGEDGNNDKSALVGANPEVEITGSDLEGAEELNNGNLLLEGAEEELISGSDGEDGNNDKSALVGANPEVEITGSELERSDELHNGNLLLEGAEEELISGSDGEDANSYKSALVGENPEMEIIGSNIAGAEELNNGKLLLEGAEKELNICASDGEDPNNDQSVLVGAKSEVNITGSAPTTKRSSTENFVYEKGSILRVSPCKLEEGTSGNPVSSPNKQQKQGQKNIHRSFDRLRSVDTFDATELINPGSELSGTLQELSKSPTTRSSCAYDGSVSSYGGKDERFPIQHLDSFENTYTYAKGASERRPRKGKGLVNSMLYGDLETQHQSYLPNGKPHVMKDSRGNQNKVLETTRHGHQHWMRTKRDEFPSRVPFHRSGSQSGYESGSPSNQMHDELYCSSSFLSPDSCEDTDQEKMKLLRMIYKLQDKLNRTSYTSGETNGRLSTGVSYKGKHISAYHSHDLHEGRFYHGMDYPRCNGRCSHGINWRQRHKFSRIPYSAEATNSTHHADHACFHCCPQEQHFSADLHPHVLFQHEELCRSHPGHNCFSSHRSYPSSPQWLTASKLPVYGRETKSDDQRHMAPEVKKYLREKKNLAKRHYRPVAGGAPFVTCHKCLKLLQLPADFLLFKRACHQLKCGECSEVLKFSLKNGSHIVSYSPNAIGPPSSGLNEQSEVINSSNLPSASHANYYHYSHADPISYSNGYDLSVSKSYSSEGDPVSLTQFLPLHGSEYDNPSVSRGTFEPITGKEKIASRHSSKTPVERDESAGLSSNMCGSGKLSAEMEARLPPKGSLHQLMGYSSPSQVIRGTRSSVEGKKSMLNGENDLSQETES